MACYRDLQAKCQKYPGNQGLGIQFLGLHTVAVLWAWSQWLRLASVVMPCSVGGGAAKLLKQHCCSGMWLSDPIFACMVSSGLLPLPCGPTAVSTLFSLFFWGGEVGWGAVSTPIMLTLSCMHQASWLQVARAWMPGTVLVSTALWKWDATHTYQVACGM